jgi:hypothetical protein
MTSRDKLLQLAERLGPVLIYLRTSPGRLATEYEEVVEDTVAAIRELLAQEPVYSVPSSFTTKPDEPRYAAPVLAVDLEAFRQEALRLLRAYEHELCSTPRGAYTAARAALVAHFGKLGGK